MNDYKQKAIDTCIAWIKNNNEKNLISQMPIFQTSEFMFALTRADLSNYDFSQINNKHLSRFTFSTQTKFPTQDKCPKDFSPNKLFRNAFGFKGCNIEKLNDNGITGKGTVIAVIDKPFNIMHNEFKKSDIEYHNNTKSPDNNFHGSAVTSRIVGQNIGIAKDAKVLFFAYGTVDEKLSQAKNQIISTLNAISQIIQKIENGERIDAINYSASFNEIINIVKNQENDVDFINTAQNLYDKYISILQAKNIPFVDSQLFNESFATSFRIDPLNDSIDNYTTAQMIYLQEEKKNNPNDQDLLDYINNYQKKTCIIDSNKCVPLEGSTNDYVIENNIGCTSWSIPQVTALFALSKQIDMSITYDKFVEAIKNTSHAPNRNGISIVNAETMAMVINQNKNYVLSK